MRRALAALDAHIRYIVGADPRAGNVVTFAGHRQWREWPKRYFGTPFTRADIAKLELMLGLAKPDAVQVALMISGMLVMCEIENDARRRTPEVRIAKRRMEGIRNAAAQLARMLPEEPVAEDLVRVPGTMTDRPELLTEEGVICMGKLHKIDQRKLADFISTAQTIKDLADVYLKTDDEFRRLHHLPSACVAGKSAVVLYLWPRLFQIWRWSGKRLAKTPGGPLHRFVSSVHATCRLSSVSPSTLRDAIIAFERERKAEGQEFDPPPWRRGDED